MPELAAVRAVLPAWAGWSSLVIYLCLALVATWIALWVITWLVREPLDQEAHWTERARQLLPARGVLMMAGWILIAEYAVLSFPMVGALSPVPWGFYVLVLVVSIWLLLTVVSWRWDRRWRGDWFTLGYALKGKVTFLLVLLPWLPVVLLMAVFVPSAPGPGLWITATGGVLLMLAMVVGGGVYLARLAGLVRLAPERLRLLVDQAAARGGVRLRGIYVLVTPTVNAFALPFLGVVAFTDRAAKVLDDAEILAIAHHEIGHLAEPATVKLGRLRGLFLFAVLGCWQPISHHLGWVGLLVALLVGFLMSMRVAAAVRRGEVAADEHAHAHTDADADAHGGGDYARALEHIHAVNLVPAVLRGKRQTHPHLYDRMVAAGVTPDFPRPEPPPKRTRLRLAALLVVVVMVAAVIVPSLLLADLAGRSEPAALRALLVTGGNDQVFGWLAEHRLEDRPEEAVVLLKAAVKLAPWREEHRRRLAEVLIRLGRNDEAEAVKKGAR